MLETSNDDGTAQAERLEQMKSEFLIAQQRRREGQPQAASRSDGTDDGPPLSETVPAPIRESRK